MAVSIRLRREGAKNRPYYRIVVADSRSPRDGKFIEIIGTYDPKQTGQNSSFNVERAEYWISKGAQPSDTVRSLIKKQKKSVLPSQHLKPGNSESSRTSPPRKRPRLASAIGVQRAQSSAQATPVAYCWRSAHATAARRLAKFVFIRVHLSRRSHCAKADSWLVF